MRTLGDERGELTLCDWRDVRARLILEDREGRRVCGANLGGRIAAGFLRRAENVPTPEEATHLLLDVAGSGVTAAAVASEWPDKTVLCLFDRRTTDRKHQWLVMPWDYDEHVVTPLHPSGLTQEERAILARLDDCLNLAGECDLDNGMLERGGFCAGLDRAMDAVLAAPTRRALREEARRVPEAGAKTA